jgi:tetratricopeptide (TPR) repeat protein
LENNLPISPQELEQIENYLAASMTAAEMDSFHQRLQAEPLLQEKLEQTQLLLVGIKEAVLHDKLSDFHRPFATPVKKIQKPNRDNLKYWLVAASLVAIVATGTYLLMNQRTGNEKLFARYFKADPGLPTTMSTTDQYEFDRAMVDYKTGKYKEALATWNKLLVVKPGNDTLGYFTGITHLALNNTTEAVSALTGVINQPQSTFRPDAYWYLALAMIRQNKTQDAINFLQHTTHSNKNELIEQLKNEPD